MGSAVMYKSRLHQMTQTMPTCLWNDSADIDELNYAIDNGAVGATCNPVIAFGILKKEIAMWRPRIEALLRELPGATEDQIGWKLVEEMSVRAAKLLEPAFEEHGGRNGRLSIQTDPRYFRDSGAILGNAMAFNLLASNMIVKIPATRAGIVAIQEATHRGLSINATVCFTVAQCIAVAEAVERGLRHRESEGKDIRTMGPVCTIMVGRLDDWLKVSLEKRGITIDPGYLEWAGVAVFKKTYGIFRERGYRLRLLSAAFRNHMHWSELIGADAVISPPSAWQKRLNAGDVEVSPRIDDPVDPIIVQQLLEHFPDFQRAYLEDGLAMEEFDSFPPTVRTLRQFIAACTDPGALVRDVLLPEPTQASAVKTLRVTMAQALVRFLAAQYVERDGVENRFIEGCFGIFGHGNLTGIGQALAQHPDLLTYYQARNEQGMVHIASGFAKMRNRLGTLACTTSIGPGATNMVTGAAAATINRVPVLLLPGDVFASRRPDPVLQQLETPWRGELSVNDCLQPVSRFWDRIQRPEQLVPAALAAMRVMTSQSETGAVTLALPQDVQTEAFDYPAEFFARRVWRIGRPLPDGEVLERALELIRGAQRPLIIAGGGVIYSEATGSLQRLVKRTGIPVCETQSGKGSVPFDHPGALGAIGATGTLAANRVAAEADLVIGIGTRYSDFTTASKTAFQNPAVAFININVAEVDSLKMGGIALVGDARATIEALGARLEGWTVPNEYRTRCEQLRVEWDKEVSRLYNLGHEPLPAQSEVLGAVNELSGPRDVVVCAAGSMPGDLHKLWRTRDAKGYHVEYGYSTMGYEIAGGLGVKLADPSREVYVMVGDGSYLMMAQEIVTSIQERAKLTIVLVDNEGFASIGSLSRSKGMAGFGTRYRYRSHASLGDDEANINGERLPADFALNAQGLGAHVFRTRNIEELRVALVAAKKIDRTVVICVPVDRYEEVPSYESWWEVPVAEVAESDMVKKARLEHEHDVVRRRWYL